jgi:hypothetical protein
LVSPAILPDNQERGPAYFHQRVDSFYAVPGLVSLRHLRLPQWIIFDGRGSIHFNATKYLDFQFGYDKELLLAADTVAFLK